jgi:hypothetical protein
MGGTWCSLTCIRPTTIANTVAAVVWRMDRPAWWAATIAQSLSCSASASYGVARRRPTVSYCSPRSRRRSSSQGFRKAPSVVRTSLVACASSSTAPAGRSGGPPLGPRAAAVVPTCWQSAHPPAPGRAQRGARLPLVRQVPHAAPAPRTASGRGGRPWWQPRPPAARGCWHRVCTLTGVNRRRTLGPGATPAASRLRHLICGAAG